MKISRVEVKVAFDDGAEMQTIVIESPFSVELTYGIKEVAARGGWRQFDNDGITSIVIKRKRSQQVDPRREKVKAALVGVVSTFLWNTEEAYRAADRILAVLDAKE